MTGLDKIIAEIRAESSKSVSEKTEAARKEAERIRAEAEKEAAALCEKLTREASARLSASKSAAESAAALKKRRMILEEKQKLISETIQQAKREVLSLPAEEYFGIIETLVASNASPSEEGTVFFNQKDSARLPVDFEKKLNSLVEGTKGKLTISKETLPIDGGFVLVYDGIDRNCSMTSIFETNIEALQDKIQKLLF